MFRKKPTYDWRLLETTYAAPSRRPDGSTKSTQADLGCTTFLFICNNTGALKTIEMLGKVAVENTEENTNGDSLDGVSPTLESILQKAEAEGMQYVPYNGKTFAVALVPTPDENQIPLK